VSLVGEPVVIVGLLKELEYKEGVVLPVVRRVIEMPRAVNESPRPRIRAPRPEALAPVVGIRLESGRPRTRMVLGAFAVGLLILIPLAVMVRDGFIGSRASVTRIDLPFSSIDDYATIVARFGRPAQDRTRKSGGAEFRSLTYPSRGFTLILKDGFYLGAVDSNGRLVHSVRR
jgi:hypothetical protein